MYNNTHDFTVVVADNQTNGKGQMGAVWTSNPSENLTFSVYLSTSFISLHNQFYLNCAVALSLYNVLNKLSIPKLSIKWPNDILSSSRKLSGVLIENIVKSNKDSYAIIGVGLNVNQKSFPGLVKATSLNNLTGENYNLDELLMLFIMELKKQVRQTTKGYFKVIHDSYEAVLFRKNKPSTFKNIEGEMFPGIIKGVNNSGHLLVYTEDEIVKEFRLKELSLLY
jgi:BirA family biotin operon repressor/biotin-[acetyl-CoA-carboxylase] ligase